MSANDTLTALETTLKARLRDASSDSSYVASLAQKGADAILKKIGEEATEVVLAAKDEDADTIVHEVADLWFHTLVMLAHQGIDVQRVTQELERRMGVSGLAEKASRDT